MDEIIWFESFESEVNNNYFYKDVRKYDGTYRGIIIGVTLPTQQYLIGRRLNINMDLSRKLETWEFIKYKLQGIINEETTETKEE